MSSKKMVIMACTIVSNNISPKDDSLPYDYERLVILSRMIKYVENEDAKRMLEWVVEIDTQIMCVASARRDNTKSGQPYRDHSKKFRKWLAGHVENYPYKKL
jgi:hypothetical protein